MRYLAALASALFAFLAVTLMPAQAVAYVQTEAASFLPTGGNGLAVLGFRTVGGDTMTVFVRNNTGATVYGATGHVIFRERGAITAVSTVLTPVFAVLPARAVGALYIVLEGETTGTPEFALTASTIRNTELVDLTVVEANATGGKLFVVLRNDTTQPVQSPLAAAVACVTPNGTITDASYGAPAWIDHPVPMGATIPLALFLHGPCDHPLVVAVGTHRG